MVSVYLTSQVSDTCANGKCGGFWTDKDFTVSCFFANFTLAKVAQSKIIQPMRIGPKLVK